MQNQLETTKMELITSFTRVSIPQLPHLLQLAQVSVLLLYTLHERVTRLLVGHLVQLTDLLLVLPARGDRSDRLCMDQTDCIWHRPTAYDSDRLYIA